MTDSVLPIVAALEEAEAVGSNLTDAVLFKLLTDVGTGPVDPVEINLAACLFTPIDDSASAITLANMLERICTGFSALVNEADDALFSVIGRTSDNINELIDLAEGEVANLTSGIASTLETVGDRIAGELDRVGRQVAGSLDDTIRGVGFFLEGLADDIGRGIGDLISTAGFQLASLTANIGNGFNALLDSAAALADRVADQATTVSEAITATIEATLESLTARVADVLTPLVSAGDSVLSRLGDVAESVPGAVLDAAEALVGGIGATVGAPLGVLGEILVTQVEAFFSDMIESGGLSHGDVLRRLLTDLGTPVDVVERIASAADDAAPTTPAFFVAALAFLVPLVVAQFLGSALDPVAQQLRQEIAAETQPSLIPPADLLDGFLKGDIPPARFQDDLRQAGFNQERIDLLLAAFRNAPDVATSVQAWLRELISEDDLDAALIANRMRPEDAALLKEVVFFVPPAQDLIRMAVREVFTPDVRSTFGLDEDFPEDFAAFARQQGISEQWARAYWAAHWTLPSPRQGFEMLHRKVIEPEELDVLLRSLDVMPFWRDKLTSIAFSPLTRVDVRRMHALGLLTDAELKARYEDLGFSPDDADMMVAFTVAFNTVEEEIPEDLEGLTRATTLNMMEDGLIEPEQAVGILQGMGIGPQAAQLYVEQRQLEIQRQERKDLIESVIQLAGGGAISLPDAQDRLAQIGLTAIEIATAVRRIFEDREQRDRIPPIGDLTKMVQLGIIDVPGFEQAAGGLGFNDEWVGRLVQLHVPEEADA